MQQPPGWGPQQGQYQQPPQQPAPKKTTSPWVWLVAIVGSLFMCGVFKNATKGTTEAVTANTPSEPGAASPPSRSAPEQPNVASSLPWLAEVKSNCSRYKSAPNEIKKSAIFNDNSAILSKAAVKNVRGKLARLSTSQGGDELTIEVDVGDVEFSTEGLMSPIKKGSPVYNAAADLAQGQCVIFSATGLRPSSMVEQSKVCDFEYFATFTSLAACP